MLIDLCYQSLLKQATEQLTAISDSPRLDAELLLAFCLEKDRSYLYAWGEKLVDETIQQDFQKLLAKRLTDYPIAYLIGKREFWSLDLFVNEAVLIPRPETELLVEVALEKIKLLDKPKILDLGTGSGAIALAIADERRDAQIIACDYSDKALAVAKHNALRNNICTVDFILSNWFENIAIERFDLIVSNPPYIKSLDPHLQDSIRYEPQQALVAGETGLNDIQIILQNAKNYMKKDAWILIEHGYDQGKAVTTLMQKNNFQQVQCLKDYNQQDRLSIATQV